MDDAAGTSIAELIEPTLERVSRRVATEILARLDIVNDVASPRRLALSDQELARSLGFPHGDGPSDAGQERIARMRRRGEFPYQCRKIGRVWMHPLESVRKFLLNGCGNGD